MKQVCPKCKVKIKNRDAEFCPSCGLLLATTRIVMVLDRSGSMASCAEATVAGFNQFVREQREVPGEAFVTLVQFDDQYEVVYQGHKMESVPLLTQNDFVPRGCTALLDAIGRSIGMADKDKPMGWQVVFVIITDGSENASKEFTRDTIKEKVAEREKAGWKFVYLGANQDAITVAADMGINTSANYAATLGGTKRAYRAVSRGLAAVRTSGTLCASQLRADAAADED